MIRQDQDFLDWGIINTLNPENILKKNEVKLHRSFIQMVMNANFQEIPSSVYANPSFSKFLILLQSTIEFLLFTNKKQKTTITELNEDLNKLQSQPVQIESCPICSKKFKGFVYIDKHIQNKHPDKFAAWQSLRETANSHSNTNSPNKKGKLTYQSLTPIYIPKSRPRDNIFEIDDPIPNLPIYDNIFNELSDSPTQQEIDQIANKAANNMTKTINEMTQPYKKHNSTPQTPSQSKRQLSNQGENRYSTEPVSPSTQMSKRPLSDEVYNQSKKEKTKQIQSSSSSRSQKNKRSSSPPATSSKFSDDKPIPIKTHRSLTKWPAIAEISSKQQPENIKRPSTSESSKQPENTKRPSTSESTASIKRPSTSESNKSQNEINNKRPSTSESNKSQNEINNKRPSSGDTNEKMQRKQMQKASASLNPKELQAVLETARADETSEYEIDEDPFILDDDTANYVETSEHSKPQSPQRRDNDITNAELDELIKCSDDELIVSNSVPETPTKKSHKKRIPVHIDDQFIPDENNTHEIDFNTSSPDKPDEQQNSHQKLLSKEQINAPQDQNILNNEQIPQKKILSQKPSVTFINANDDSEEYEYDDIHTIPQKKSPQQNNNRQQQKKEEEIDKKMEPIQMPNIKENRVKKQISHNQQPTPVHVKRMGGYDISNAELEQLIFESTESES